MKISTIIQHIKKIKLSHFSIGWQSCGLCNWKIQIKFFDDEMGVRCSRCMATPVSQMLGRNFQDLDLKKQIKVYEMSSRGAFVRFLKKVNVDLFLSEFFDCTKPGTIHNGVMCQNVEELTFEDQSFDVCTSLEVFEHVEDDDKGFKEIFRVLKITESFYSLCP